MILSRRSFLQAGAATGGLRLSPHVYNTMSDIELAIRGVRELLG